MPVPETITIDEPRDADELVSSTVTISGTALPQTWIDVYDWMDFAGQAQVDDRGRWTITIENVDAGDHIFVARPGKGRDDTMSVSVSCTVTPGPPARGGRPGMLGRLFRRDGRGSTTPSAPSHTGDDAKSPTDAEINVPDLPADESVIPSAPSADEGVMPPALSDDEEPARASARIEEPEVASRPEVPGAPEAPLAPAPLASGARSNVGAESLLEMVAVQDTRGRPITFKILEVSPDTLQIEHAEGVMTLKLEHVADLSSLLRTVGWAAIHSPEQNAAEIPGERIWVQTRVDGGLTACEIRAQSGAGQQSIVLPLFVVPSLIRSLETVTAAASDIASIRHTE